MEQQNLVVIAASRGGFSVLRTLVGGLPADLPAAVCIVLHIGRHDSRLPDLMSCWGPLPATYPGDGDALQPGKIYVAPPDRHLILERGRLRLSDSAPENFCRPAADPLFRSAAVEYGRAVIGVVLSGDLDDGAAGLAMIQARGGYCLVQDPAGCEAPSMPAAAMQAVGGAADRVGPEHLADAIVAAVRSAPSRVPHTTDTQWPIEKEEKLAARGLVSPEDLDTIGERSALTCPACGGSLWQVESGPQQRYRCHTGHAFSELSLEQGITGDVERALWSAVRTVKERIVFAQRRRDWAERVGDRERFAVERERIAEAETLADTLQQALRRLAHSAGEHG